MKTTHEVGNLLETVTRGLIICLGQVQLLRWLTDEFSATVFRETTSASVKGRHSCVCYDDLNLWWSRSPITNPRRSLWTNVLSVKLANYCDTSCSWLKYQSKQCASCLSTSRQATNFPIVYQNCVDTFVYVECLWQFTSVVDYFEWHF